MPEDASLDEFLGVEESGGGGDDEAERDDAGAPEDETDSEATGEDTADAASTASDDPTEDGGRVDPASVEPATTTAAWSADGGPCSDCGTIVEYRWHGEAGLVCPDCKEW